MPNPEPGEWIYDVFLSYCGKDTSGSFASDLRTALTNAGLFVFMEDDDDDRPTRSGDKQISLSVLDAIERSRISIIMFSRNYADSRLRLLGLEKIMECLRTKGQKVVPLFYDVYPSDVRDQTGIFGEAFVRLLLSTQGIWMKNNCRSALRDASNVPGLFTLVDSRKRSRIEEAVAFVTNLLGHKQHQQKDELFVAKYPVGLESRVQEVIQLLNNRQQHTVNDVIILGILGLGGIGKTTLAKAIYNEIGGNFEAKSFLSVPQAEFKKYDGVMISLQERLLSDIIKLRDLGIATITGGKELLKRGLSQKRVLLVLDDVYDMGQLSALCGSRDWFGSGSIIIITTRDETLLSSSGVDHIKQLEMLSHDESLELFSWHAFEKEHPPSNYYSGLSKAIVSCSNGLPLALEVLRSFLFSWYKKGYSIEWESTLRKLKRIPKGRIHDLQRLSFDLLDEEEKRMFLDIACYLVGMEKNDVPLALVRKSRHNNDVVKIRPEVLQAKGLITIDENNLVGMHSLVRDMGLEIIRKENIGIQKVYDVFLSFRGKDTRATFVSHLHTSLQMLDCIFTKMTIRLKGENKYRHRCNKQLELQELQSLFCQEIMLTQDGV